MADLYAKKLESERKTLWATCRLKGLAKGTPERERIAELDRLIAEHANKASLPRSGGQGAHPKHGGGTKPPQARTAK